MRPRTGSPPPRTLTTDSQLMQDYLETSGILVNPDGAPAIATFPNPEGDAEAIALDVDGNVCHVCREPLSDSGWNMFGVGAGFGAIGAVDSASVWALGRLDGSVWQGRHGRWTRAPGVLPNGQVPSEIAAGSDGTVWAIDVNGAVYAKGASTSQQAPDLPASAAPVALRDEAGALHVLCIDGAGDLWTIAQDALAGSWGLWTNLRAPAGVSLAATAATPTPGGGLDVFAVASGGTAVWSIGQTTPGQPWSAWASLGTPPGVSLGTLACALNAAAQPEIFASDARGQIWTNAQVQSGGGWTGWQSLGAPGLGTVARLAVAAAASGALVLFAAGAGTSPVAMVAQTGPGGGWGPWSSLGFGQTAGAIAALAVALNQNGCLDVFAIAGGTGSSGQATAWHCMQQAPNGSWGSWSALGAPSNGLQPGPVAIARNDDGRLELFAASPDGLAHCWQQAPGSGWSGWDGLGRPGSAALAQIAATRDRAGCLAVLALDADASLSMIQQTVASNGWGPWVPAWWAWSPLGAPAPLAHAPSGRGDDFWAVTTGGALARWSAGAWSTVAAPASAPAAQSLVASTPAAPAAWVSAGAGGTVWVLDAGGTLYQWVNGTYQALPGSLGGVASFAAGGAANLWATAAPGSQEYALFRYDGGAWGAAETPPLHGGWNPPQVSVAADGKVWVLDGSGAVWSRESRSPVQWATRGAPAASARVASLTAAPGASAWAVDDAGAIWRNNGGQWIRFSVPLPGGARAQQVAAGAAGALWAIDTAGNPYQYAAASAAWQPVAALPALAAAPATWALGKNGTIWQFSGGAWTQLMHSLPGSIWPAQVTAAADGIAWALDIHGALYRFSTADSAWVAVPGAPPGLVQVAVVDAGSLWGIAPSGPGAFALYGYVDGGWHLVAGAPLMSWISAMPQVSVGPEGTAWVLDGSGIARTVRWNAAASAWTGRKPGIALQSIAAAGIDQAWAVAGDGSFQRNFGSRWVEANAPLPLGVPAAAVSVGGDGTVWALDGAGALYALGAPVAPAPPTFGNTGPPAACLDGAGLLRLFATDDQATLWTAAQSAASGWWRGWLSLGTPAGESVGQPAAALDAEGRLQIFAVGVSAGALWQRRQTTAGGGWGPWTSLGAPAGVSLAGLAVAPNQDGRLQVFAVGADSGLYTVWETAPGVWSGWGVLSPAVVPVSSASPILRSGGILAVVALGSDQAVHVISQTAPNDGWGPWTPLGTPPGLQIESVAVAPNANGLLQIFAVGSDDGLYTTWETAPGTWAAWGPLIDPPTAVLVVGLSAALDGAGLLHVLAVDEVQTLHHVAQTAPSNGWGAWSALGSVTGSSVPPVMVADGSGAPAAFVIASTTPGVWVVGQSDDAGDWGTLTVLGAAEPLRWSQVQGAPALAQPPSGSASSSWAVTAEGDVVNWNGQQWTPAPLPGGVAAAGVSAGSDGSVWAVSDQPNACYRFVDGVWLAVGGGGDFAQAPVGSAGNLWCPAVSGAVLRSGDGGNTWWEDTGLATMPAQLSAAADGTVWALDTAGAAWVCPGWRRTMRPAGMSGWPEATGTAVAAGRDSNGLRYLFFLQDNGLLAYSFEVFRHTWVEPIEIAGQGVSNLGVAIQQDTGDLIAYGVSGTTSLLVARRAPGEAFFLTASQIAAVQWTSSRTWPMNLTGLDLCAVDAATWYWFGLGTTGVGENCLVAATGSAQGSTASFAPVWNPQNGQFPSGFTAIVRLPWPRPAGAPWAVVLDDSQNLLVIAVSPASLGPQYGQCAVFALTGPSTSLPAGATAVAAMWQAGAGMPQEQRLYATAPLTAGGSDALWVARLLDPSLPVTEPTAWTDWIPLGGNYLSMATGPAGHAASTLFATSGTDASLAGVSQDPVTGKWTAIPVKRPSEAGATVEPVSMYHTLITLSDTTGTIPQPGVPVTITAASPVAIWVAGGVHLVDAVQGVTCPTDASGTVRIRTLATGLHTPQLNFVADGLPSGQSAYPPQHVHDFLAGSGQLAAGGGQPVSLTASTLMGATVGGRPLSPSLTQCVAQNTVTWTGQITQMPGGASASASAAAGVGRGTSAGWAIDLSDRSRPIVHAFADAAAVRAYRAALTARRGGLPGSVTARRGGLPGSIFSHMWHGVTHAAEDVVHAVENGAVSVDKLVVDTENKVVSFSLSIAGDALGVFDMVVNTVEDAMRAIEALLATLIADIEMIIEWLQLLFQWEDIWQTKEAIEQFLGQGLAIIGGEVGAARAAIPGLVSALEASLGPAFGKLIETFPYQRFANLPSSPAAAAHGLPQGEARPGSSPPPPGTSLAHYGWLLAKTLDNITPSYSLGSLGSVNLAGLIQAVDAGNLLSVVQQAASDLVAYLTGAISDPASFPQLTIAEFLNAARSLLFAVLDAIEDLLEVFLDVIQQALAGIGGVFDHGLDIPVISALYRFVTGLLGHSENLTVLHLCALLIAVPLTITYKLANGGQTPYSGVNLGGRRVPAAGPGRASGGAGMAPADAWKAAFLNVGLFVVTPLVGVIDGLALLAGPGGRPSWVVPLLGTAASVAGMVQQINSWPAGFPAQIDPQTALAGWVDGGWGVYWGAIMMDLCLTVGLKQAPPLADLRNFMRFASGTLALALATMAVSFAEGETPPAMNSDGVGQVVVKPLPLFLSFLMIGPVRQAIFEATDGFDPAVVKTLADLACNVALPILHDRA